MIHVSFSDLHSLRSRWLWELIIHLLWHNVAWPYSHWNRISPSLAYAGPLKSIYLLWGGFDTNTNRSAFISLVLGVAQLHPEASWSGRVDNLLWNLNSQVPDRPRYVMNCYIYYLGLVKFRRSVAAMTAINQHLVLVIEDAKSSPAVAAAEQLISAYQLIALSICGKSSEGRTL